MNPSTDIETGTVGILNVGDGDTKLSFNKNNPAERIRAARIVKDMIRRGYALLIEIERDGQKVFTRAVDFDEDVCEYIIADFDPIVSETVDAEVRVQRLHDISEEDAIAEGIEESGSSVAGTKMWRNYTPGNGCTSRLSFPQNSYRSLWGLINGPGSWESNPWVWAISFKPAGTP